MADNDFSNKALDNVIKNTASSIQQEFIDKQLEKGVSKENLKKMSDEEAYEKALKELINNTKTFNQAVKNNIKVLKDQDAVYKQLANSAKQVASDTGNIQKPGFWQQLATKLAGSGTKEDAYQEMWRVRQRFGGLEQMFSGNFVSGLSQFAGSFQTISSIMKGPYFLAIQAVITGLLKFDNALAKASATAASVTGGMGSEYVGRGLASMAYNAQLKENLYAIGMQGKRDELIAALQKGYGYGSYRGQQSDFITSMAYSQKGLGSLGISAETSNSLLERLRLIEGKDTTGIYAQLGRLTNLWDARNKNALKTSPEYAINQMMTLADQTKGLGTNFEWASRIVQRFEKGLKDGTVALSDFAAVNRSIRGGGISKNAGIATLVADYASRAGMNLPSGFTNSNVLGQSFAISTQSMLANNQFARAYQGQIQEMLDQIGGVTKEERAGALQLILQERGININPETAEKAIRSNGQIDLIGTGIIGSKMGEQQKIEQKRAEQYQTLVETYYKGTTSWHNQVLTKLDKVISNTGSSMVEGFEGNIDPNATGLKAFGQAVGYSLSTGIWEGFGEMFEKIGKRAAQLPPGQQ